MKRPRRIILRITPLLDLLLIVLFAQFMEQSSSSQVQLAEKESLRAAAEAQQQAAEQARLEAIETRRQFAQANNRLREQVEQLRSELAANQQQAEQLQQAVDSLAKLAQQQLKIPPEAVRQAMDGASVPEVRRLMQELARASTESVAGIIRYLRTNVEFRNHWDVWEVHISSDDSLRLKINDQTVAEDLFVSSSDNFLKTAREHFDRAEPKSTVLILLSWSDASYQTRLLTREGIDALTAILENKWARPKKFYLSVLGFTPKTP
ncbi:MAG: hypothetical protein ACLFUJ_11800 [Phycisphaerae bacterium]